MNHDPLQKMRMATANPEKQLRDAAKTSLVSPGLVKDEPRFPPLKLRPIGIGILLEIPDQTDSESVDGIIVPEATRKRMRREFNRVQVVRVLAVGEEVRTVKAGDRVLVDIVQADPTVFDTRPYWIVTPAVIKGVVEEGGG